MLTRSRLGSILLIAFTLSSLMLTGCGASIGTYSTCAETQTQLNQSNYKVIQKGISGSSYCWYLFSAIPLGQMELYQMAMDELRSKVQDKGKAMSLVNVTQDVSVKNFIVVKKAMLTLTADVIEFEE